MDTFLSRYKVRKIYEDTYSILDYGMDQDAVYLYLLVGADRALLVDSGFGGIDLRRVTAGITDKEVICLCTHGHVDHACGAYQFPKAYLHSLDFPIYEKWCSPEAVRGFIRGGLSADPPAELLADPRYEKLAESFENKRRGPLLPLEERPEFDLGGGRVVTWYPIPGHTPGSVSVIDWKYRTAFDSDGAASGVWLFLPESLSVAAYREALAGYQTFLEDHHIDRHFVGHMGRCLNTRRNRDLLACCDTILVGRKRPYSVNMHVGAAQLMFSHDTLIFYR